MLNNIKAKAYGTLSICGFDHPKAKREGFDSGWEMLLDQHDENGAAFFYRLIGEALSQKEVKILFDGIVREYTDYPDFLSYVDVVAPAEYSPVCSTLPKSKSSQTIIKKPQNSEII